MDFRKASFSCVSHRIYSWISQITTVSPWYTKLVSWKKLRFCLIPPIRNFLLCWAWTCIGVVPNSTCCFHCATARCFWCTWQSSEVQHWKQHWKGQPSLHARCWQIWHLTRIDFTLVIFWASFSLEPLWFVSFLGAAAFIWWLWSSTTMSSSNSSSSGISRSISVTSRVILMILLRLICRYQIATVILNVIMIYFVEYTYITYIYIYTYIHSFCRYGTHSSDTSSGFISDSDWRLTDEWSMEQWCGSLSPRGKREENIPNEQSYRTEYQSDPLFTIQ